MGGTPAHIVVSFAGPIRLSAASRHPATCRNGFVRCWQGPLLLSVRCVKANVAWFIRVRTGMRFLLARTSFVFGLVSCVLRHVRQVFQGQADRAMMMAKGTEASLQSNVARSSGRPRL
jgi:hypothetical protein